MFTGLSIFFICAEVALIALLAYLVIKKRAIVDKKSLIYAIPVFLIVYAQYVMATVYNGSSIDFFTAFNFIHKALEAFGLEVEIALIRPLAEANVWFLISAVGACILSFITTVFSVLVLFGTLVGNYVKKTRNFNKGGDVVFGYSPDSVEYALAHDDSVLWVEELNRATYNDLIKRGCTIHKAKLNKENVAKCISKGNKDAKLHFIVFKDTDFSYFDVLSTFQELKEGGDKQLFLHLEANVNEISLVRDKYVSEVSKDANSFVLSFCRYELLARRFLTEHCITKYVPHDFYNKNLTLKDDKEINVVFLGMGKVNFELFKLMAANYQFAKEKDGKLYSAPVHYYTYDNNGEKFNNEHFIRLLNEHDEIFKHSDFPAAEKICDLKTPLPIDAHSMQARQQIRQLVNENTFTCFVLSMEDDFKDATFAHEMKNALGEGDNYKIFVRAKHTDGKRLNKAEKNIIYFGENDSTFSHANIVNDDLMKMAQNVNDLYNDMTADDVAQLRNWQELPVIEQYSNISAAMHVYFKLHMLGYDLKKGVQSVSKEDFLANHPDVIMGEKGNDYNYFFGTATANVLAFIEHARWNAYYLFAGYKPLLAKDFWWKKNKNNGYYELQHKKLDAKRHACLTSYLGIDKLLRKKQEIIEDEIKLNDTLPNDSPDKKNIKGSTLLGLADIYRYDYMVVDGMYDALSRLGYSIVKK